MFVKLSKLSLVSRTLRWLRASCQMNHQVSISVSCTRPGSSWKFALHRPVHRLQLSLDLTPHTFYRVRVGTCVRVNKVLGVVNHEVYVADTVQVEVWRKLVRDYCCSRLDELLH